jgi:hypothetical protein
MKIEMGGLHNTDGIINAYNSLIRNHEGKKWSLVRPKCRWEENTEMDLRKIQWDGADWIHLAQAAFTRSTITSISLSAIPKIHKPMF